MRNSLLAAAILCAVAFGTAHYAVQAEMAALVQEQPPDEEIPPPRNPPLPGAENPLVVQEPLQGKRPEPAVALVAGNLVGFVFFAVGIVGWIVLGISMWVLERRRPPGTSS